MQLPAVSMVCPLLRRVTFVKSDSYALRAACVPPAKNPSPLARIFGVSRKKSPKTPFETHGFKTSFPRRTAQIVPPVTARQNRREKTSLKCCMATAPPSLVRLPVQNVERCTPTFQSGAAAKREAGAIPDLHQNAVFTKRKVGAVSRNQVPPKGGQGTIGPLRRFFSPFLSAGGKKRGRRRLDKIAA